MKRLSIIVLCLCSLALAQDRWDGQDFIWRNGTGAPLLLLDPCFGPDTNSILISDPDINRIMRLNYRDADTFIQFLPESLSVDGYADMAPFLTADGQNLYFSSNRPGGYGGFDIWVTQCVDGVWQMPVNLNSNINTVFDEMGPSLKADGTEIYFYCHTNSYESYGYIAKSALVDGQWTPAQALPAPVNSEYGERDPAISPDGQYLYFISHIPMNTLDHSAWVCQRNGAEWSERVLIDGFINHIWETCPFMPEGNPISIAIDASGRRQVYAKLEVYECFDPETDIYMSYFSTGISDNTNIVPQEISLALYPNPFNSSLAISISGKVPSDIAIYDLLGHRIRTFSDVATNAVIWNGKSDTGIPCASGMYFVRASSGERSIVRSATMLK